MKLLRACQVHGSPGNKDGPSCQDLLLVRRDGIQQDAQDEFLQTFRCTKALHIMPPCVSEIHPWFWAPFCRVPILSRQVSYKFYYPLFPPRCFLIRVDFKVVVKCYPDYLGLRWSHFLSCFFNSVFQALRDGHIQHRFGHRFHKYNKKVNNSLP